MVWNLIKQFVSCAADPLPPTMTYTVHGIVKVNGKLCVRATHDRHLLPYFLAAATSIGLAAVLKSPFSPTAILFLPLITFFILTRLMVPSTSVLGAPSVVQTLDGGVFELSDTPPISEEISAPELYLKSLLYADRLERQGVTVRISFPGGALPREDYRNATITRGTTPLEVVIDGCPKKHFWFLLLVRGFGEVITHKTEHGWTLEPACSGEWDGFLHEYLLINKIGNLPAASS